MSGAGNPPAGWYADPTQPGSERWWDGASWGEETRLPTAAAPIVAPPAVAPPAVAPPMAAPPSGSDYPGVSASASIGSEEKSGCLGLSTGVMLAIVAVLSVLGLVIAGAVIMFAGADNDDVAATETTVESGTTANPDAATTTEPNSDGSESTTTASGDGVVGGATGDGAEDVISCTRVDEDTIVLEMMNNGTETSSYWLTVGFFDDSGTRLADESSFVNFLRPGEHSIEEHFVFEEAGTTCEVLDVDRFPGESPAEQIADVGTCVIADEPDSFDDFAASISVTNSTSATSDYSVEVAFVDPSGIRRGTGSAYIEAVRANETAPGDIFSSTDYVAGYSCEIVGVTRTDS